MYVQSERGEVSKVLHRYEGWIQHVLVVFFHDGSCCRWWNFEVSKNMLFLFLQLVFDFCSYFGFMSNIPQDIDVSGCNEENIEERLTQAFDGKKVQVDFYKKEEDQNRIMNLKIV